MHEVQIDRRYRTIERTSICVAASSYAYSEYRNMEYGGAMRRARTSAAAHSMCVVLSHYAQCTRNRSSDQTQEPENEVGRGDLKLP